MQGLCSSLKHTDQHAVWMATEDSKVERKEGRWAASGPPTESHQANRLAFSEVTSGACLHEASIFPTLNVKRQDMSGTQKTPVALT